MILAFALLILSFIFDCLALPFGGAGIALLLLLETEVTSEELPVTSELVEEPDVIDSLSDVILIVSILSWRLRSENEVP